MAYLFFLDYIEFRQRILHDQSLAFVKWQWSGRPLIFGSRFIFSIRFACHLIELLIVLGWPAKHFGWMLWLNQSYPSDTYYAFDELRDGDAETPAVDWLLVYPEFFCGWHNSTILINTYWTSRFRSIGIGSQLSSLSFIFIAFFIHSFFLDSQFC